MSGNPDALPLAAGFQPDTAAFKEVAQGGHHFPVISGAAVHR